MFSQRIERNVQLSHDSRVLQDMIQLPKRCLGRSQCGKSTTQRPVKAKICEHMAAEKIL